MCSSYYIPTNTDLNNKLNNSIRGPCPQIIFMHDTEVDKCGGRRKTFLPVSIISRNTYRWKSGNSVLWPRKDASLSLQCYFSRLINNFELATTTHHHSNTCPSRTMFVLEFCNCAGFDYLFCFIIYLMSSLYFSSLKTSVPILILKI